MGKFDDRLADYIDVKQRIALFYAAYPDGRLVTAKVRVRREPDDVPRVWVKALAFRTPEDTLPGTGWSWMTLPGGTPYTRGSEIENAETSAWGRAIGALGIGIERSIASADEVRAKSLDAKVERAEDGSLIGIAEAGDKATSDFLMRQTPDGPALGFRLRGERGGILVECHGELAVQLAAFRDATIGQRVTCWGTIGDREITVKGKRVTYQALAATRIRVPGVGDLPTEPAEPEPPVEAESEPLFSDAEQEMLDLAMGVTS
jgi:hypothetical protein